MIFAIGQVADFSFLDPADGVQTERGLIKVNRETYQTTAPDIFACGDIAHGARLFIDAIASAQIAARSMHDFLRGTRTDVVVRKQWKAASYTMAERWNVLERENPAALESDRRAGSLEIVEMRLRGGDGPDAGGPLPPLQREYGLRDRASASPVTDAWTSARRT